MATNYLIIKIMNYYNIFILLIIKNARECGKEHWCCNRVQNQTK